ncbi:MAG: class I SAM-dependent methyltransferase [Symploca sp. SIO1B1]|nr:class I SAM-dependent methyltransferase [Symploca sp. SIO1B1]
MNKSVEDVREFWEANPLWSGESNFPLGTKEWFDEHRQVVIEDCMAGNLDERFFPKNIAKQKILDLGCGVGFWVIEFGRQGYQDITAADLTLKALELTQKRCELSGVKATLTQENAERLTFPDATFSHVNCQGVIHQTPNTVACIEEIHRVLKQDGTASISVYYQNIFLRNWKFLKFPASLLSKLGFGLAGRGREKIYAVDDVNELVRYFDGANNPIGKAYSREEFIKMLQPYFEIQEVFLHLFPARSFPFKIPKFIHKQLDSLVGFLIIANVKKL